MTDTHTHLYMPDSYPDKQGEESVENALQCGVHTLIFPNVDTSSITPLLALVEKYPEHIFSAMGLHPTEVKENYKQDLAEIEQHLTHPSVVAIGEVGIDLHWDSSTLLQQIDAFKTQISWAAKYNLPLIIHQRDALNEVLDTLTQCNLSVIPGIVFHCFTEDKASAIRIIEAIPNVMFGIGGVSTFKNAAPLREALHTIGPERIVLETDAPYLAPTPHRGSRNESEYIPLILNAIATELQIPVAELEQITDLNARKLFPKLPAAKKC